MDIRTSDFERQDTEYRRHGLDLVYAESNPPRFDPQPLGGNEHLSGKPNDSFVFLLEGVDACHDAMAEVCPRSSVVWTPKEFDPVYALHSMLEVDWTPLKGRKVIIWTRPGLAGEILADKLRGHLQGIASEATPMRWPDGYAPPYNPFTIAGFISAGRILEEQSRERIHTLYLESKGAAL